MYKVWKLKR